MRTHTRAHERGAIAVQAAFAMLILLMFSGLVVDYGVFWVSRAQAQTSADAGALAGASALACGLQKDVRKVAAEVAEANVVWSKKPKVSADTDVTFPTCPDGSPTCVRVNTYRDAASGKALPTYLLQLAGLKTQGVRATATAQLMPVGTNDCVRPFALPDRWIETYPVAAPWTTDSVFDTLDDKKKPLAVPDIYVPPGPGGPGTGHTLPEACGLKVTIREVTDWKDQSKFSAYLAVVIPRTDGVNGAVAHKANIVGCNGVQMPISGGTLQVKPGEMTGPTREGLDQLFAQDPAAYWDEGTKSIKGGCMAAGTCAVSPRLVTLPLYDPAHYAANRAGGGSEVKISNFMGFFLDRHNGTDIVGYVTTAAAPPRNTSAMNYRSAFLKASVLVR